MFFPFKVSKSASPMGHIQRHRIIEARWIYFTGAVGAIGVLCGIFINPLFSLVSLVSGLTPAIRKLRAHAKRKGAYRQPVADLSSLISTRHLFTGIESGASSGEVRMKVNEAVGDEMFARRIRFGTTEENVEDITRLNMYGYYNSEYGSLADPIAYSRKLARNRAITRKNPYAFAALVDADNPDVLLGFTAILPLTAEGYRLYVSPPGVPDNEISEFYIAKRGEPFSHALIFAIANFKLYRRIYPIACLKGKTSHLEPYCSDVPTVIELTQLLSYQLGVLLADGGCQGDILLVGQSKIQSVQHCYQKFGMIETGDIVTADDEPVYHGVLTVQNLNEAQVLLAEREARVALMPS